MICDIKYDTVSNNTVITKHFKGVIIPCKPSIGDKLYLKEIGKLLVTEITVVCRMPENRNMKQPNFLILCELC